MHNCQSTVENCSVQSVRLPGGQAIEPVFPQQQDFAMMALAQISSSAIRCSFNTLRARFRRVPGFRWKVPVQMQGEVSEASSAGTWWGSEGFQWDTWWGSGGCADAWWRFGGSWCRYLMRFRRVPVQIPCEVLEGSDEDAWWGCGRFRW